MHAEFRLWSPRDLERGRREFERWRRRRRRGERIPADLWRTATDLARRHGVSKASQALHLDYYALQRRLGEGLAKSGAREAAFVELSLPATAPGGGCEVEICDASGAKVRVEVAGLSAAELATFVRTICGREP